MKLLFVVLAITSQWQAVAADAGDVIAGTIFFSQTSNADRPVPHRFVWSFGVACDRGGTGTCLMVVGILGAVLILITLCAFLGWYVAQRRPDCIHSPSASDASLAVSVVRRYSRRGSTSQGSGGAPAHEESSAAPASST